jgi:hypothetical protein
MVRTHPPYCTGAEQAMRSDPPLPVRETAESTAQAGRISSRAAYGCQSRSACVNSACVSRTSDIAPPAIHMVAAASVQRHRHDLG